MSINAWRIWQNLSLSIIKKVIKEIKINSASQKVIFIPYPNIVAESCVIKFAIKNIFNENCFPITWSDIQRYLERDYGFGSSWKN